MQKPSSVMVFGVLNLLFAVLGFFGTIGSVLVLLGMNTDNPVHVIMQESAVYRAFMYVSVPLGLIFIGMLALAGVGLLMSKPWGRTATIVYAIYAIVMGLIGSLFSTVFLVVPLLEQASHASGPEAAGAVGGAVGGLFGGCIGLFYPIFQLIFMYRKNVVEYFKQVK
ncbi:MAG: hypothetical protein ACOC1F_05025 [Myxococcota bacterium]